MIRQEYKVQIRPVATCGPGDKASLLLLFHFQSTDVLYWSQTEEQEKKTGEAWERGYRLYWYPHLWCCEFLDAHKVHYIYILAIALFTI